MPCPRLRRRWRPGLIQRRERPPEGRSPAREAGCDDSSVELCRVETPPERWPARSGQSVYAGVAFVVLLTAWLVFVWVASNDEHRERLEHCALMIQAFNAGDDVASATARTNEARSVVGGGDAFVAAQWWHLRHGDGLLHGEEPDAEVVDLPPRKPATGSIFGDAASKEQSIRKTCARLAER